MKIIWRTHCYYYAMKLEVPEGKYVVAVSGGVDSVVLLHLLTQNSELRTQNLIVAHFDHGMREDSADDEVFVRRLAEGYGLPYVSGQAYLGSGASEAAAREVRYEFLFRTMKEQGAGKVITAHHEDDLLETIILNMLRGTGRNGLDPLLSHPDIMRPLLPYDKKTIKAFARNHDLTWREDPTNVDTKYTRNKIRSMVMPDLKDARKKLLQLNKDAHGYNREIQSLLEQLQEYLHNRDGSLIRKRFVALPHKVAAEYMHHWLSENGVKSIDMAVVTKATIAAKTLPAGKRIDLGKACWLQSDKTSLKIVPK
jgi:tRNA(Ile)-lysidine synthetase-like protein